MLLTQNLGRNFVVYMRGCAPFPIVDKVSAPSKYLITNGLSNFISSEIIKYKLQQFTLYTISVQTALGVKQDEILNSISFLFKAGVINRLGRRTTKKDIMC
jgi:hypothetical protein